MSSAEAPASLCDTDQLPLTELVAVAATTADHCDGAILRVTGDPPALGSWGLLGQHPLSQLLGLTAPAAWRALGVRCTGRAHHLTDQDPPTDYTFRRTDPVPISFTFLLDRGGHAAALATSECGWQWLDGPEGLVGDACRRALGLATAPPPISATDLWLDLWLHVVVSVASAPDRPEPLTWDTVAALHPAIGGRYDAGRHHAVALAELTQVLGQMWSWSELRHHPDIVALAEPPPSPAIRSWMDDGMFARWLLTQLPDRAWLERELRLWVAAPIVACIDEVLTYAEVTR
jgi:hypothetical protein